MQAGRQAGRLCAAALDCSAAPWGLKGMPCPGQAKMTHEWCTGQAQAMHEWCTGQAQAMHE